jgi:hypothetical protein
MPIRYPSVLIVDAPTSSANVLYDFQDDTQPLDTGSKTALEDQSWSFGDLELLGDPDAVGVDWGLRRVTFSQEIVGRKSAALARQAAMSKALLRRRFWLKFQLTSSTTPVYWDAYRTAPGTLSLEQVYASDSLSDRWLISGGIDMKPFSFGERITQPTKTVGNNPANDMTVPSAGFNLPAIKGDTPAGLRVTITPQGTNPRYVQKWLVACIASDRSAPVRRRAIGDPSDLFTSGANTSNGASDATAIGGTSRTVSLPANDPLEWRIVGSTPTAPPGQYAVYLRMTAKQTNSGTGVIGATVTVQMAVGTTAQPKRSLIGTRTSVEFGQALSTSPDDWRYVYLGNIGVGEGIPDDLVADTSRNITILAGSATATPVTLRLDDLMFVPIAGKDLASTTSLVTLLSGDLTSVAGPTTPLISDADTEVTWLANANPSSVTIYNAGGFPTADPAAAFNTLLVLPLEDRALNGDPTSGVTRTTALATTTQVDVSYHPRASWIGDGNT